MRKSTSIAAVASQRTNTVQTTLLGSSSPRSGVSSQQGSATRQERDARTRAIFPGIRGNFACPQCGTVGLMSFNTDKNGNLRLRCNAKDPVCNSGISSVAFLEIIDAGKSASPQVSQPTTPSIHLPLPSTSFTTDGDNILDELNHPHISSLAKGKRRLVDTSLLPSEDLATAQAGVDHSFFERLLHEKDQIIASLRADLSSQAGILREMQANIRELTSHILRPTVELVTHEDTLQPALIPASSLITQVPTEVRPNIKQDIIIPILPKAAENTIPPPSAHIPRATRPTFAEVAKRFHVTEDRQKNFFAALAAIRPRRPVAPSSLLADTHNGVRRVYLAGIDRRPIKDLRNFFRDLGIRTSQILHYQFVGKSTLEILTSAVYDAALRRRLQQFGCSVLDKYDPTQPLDASLSAEGKQKMLDAFVARVHKTIANSPNITVQRFFTAWLEEKHLPVPTPQPLPIVTLGTDAISMAIDDPTQPTGDAPTIPK